MAKTATPTGDEGSVAPSAVNPRLFQAIIAVQAEAPGIGKSGRNEYDRYDYAKLDDFVTAIQPLLKKHKLAIVTSVDEITHEQPRLTKNKNHEYPVTVKLGVHILHEDGGVLTISQFGQAQDRGDKAIYKAITGARKYALASIFNLATSDDPETTHGEPSSPVSPTQNEPAYGGPGDPLARAMQQRPHGNVPMSQFANLIGAPPPQTQPAPPPTSPQPPQPTSPQPQEPEETASKQAIKKMLEVRLNNAGYDPKSIDAMLVIIAAVAPNEAIRKNPKSLFTQGTTAQQLHVYNAIKALDSRQVCAIIEAHAEANQPQPLDVQA
jgi:hypothetical protein